MTIEYRILGEPGRDNALVALVDSGQAQERLLFDCGEGCLTTLSFGEIQAVDHLFFSHLHMDHVGGFDSFFRSTFNRGGKPNHIWGPPATSQILQHRFQGFLWNLHEEMNASWRVTDVEREQLRTVRFELREAFAITHDDGVRPYASTILETTSYCVDAITLEHRTPTLAYVLREKPRHNVDVSRLATLGLRPGPWLKRLKDEPAPGDDMVIDGSTHSLAALREQLLVETPGDSIAYLTDFLLNEAAAERLVDALQGCRILVCEAQYRHADLELARKNFHMTTVLSAGLAARVRPEKLVLFHLSDRYRPPEWNEMLREAQAIFANTEFPRHWTF
ncbi:MAG: MBL fold metallo-hydrolase [Pirellulales bacterium]